MPFAILQKTDAEKHQEVESNISTTEQAKATIKKTVEAYESHGYDAEQDQWWARDEYGVQWTFWVEGR